MRTIEVGKSSQKSAVQFISTSNKVVNWLLRICTCRCEYSRLPVSDTKMQVKWIERNFSKGSSIVCLQRQYTSLWHIFILCIIPNVLIQRGAYEFLKRHLYCLFTGAIHSHLPYLHSMYCPWCPYTEGSVWISEKAALLFVYKSAVDTTRTP